MSEFCLVLVCPPSIEEKLLDALLVIARVPRAEPAERPRRPEFRISSAILNPPPISPRRTLRLAPRRLGLLGLLGLGFLRRRMA